MISQQQAAKFGKYVYGDPETNLVDSEHIAKLHQHGAARVRVHAMGTETFVAMECKECTCIAFQGSNELADWRANFRFFWRHYNGFGKLVRGFFEYAQQLLPYVVAALDEIHQPGRPIVVMGHSRGGALACLTAWLLWTTGRKDVQRVITWGCPRFAWGGEAKRRLRALPVQHDRWVNGDDIVTTLPRSWWGFFHWGRRKGLPETWWKRLPFARAASHSMLLYERKICGE